MFVKTMSFRVEKLKVIRQNEDLDSLLKFFFYLSDIQFSEHYTLFFHSLIHFYQLNLALYLYRFQYILINIVKTLICYTITKFFIILITILSKSNSTFYQIYLSKTHT